MIGDRIKLLRNEIGLTQKQLADELSMSRQAISHWENGVGEPNIEDLIKLSKIFNVSTDYLLGLTNIRDMYTYNEEIQEYINDCLKVYKKHIKKD